MPKTAAVILVLASGALPVAYSIHPSSFSHVPKVFHLHHTALLLGVVQVNHSRCRHQHLPDNSSPRPIYNGYMKVCPSRVWSGPPVGLPHSHKGASTVLLYARSVLLQSLALSDFPDIYFFFGGWHLLFSVYMCDSSPVLFDPRPDRLFLGSSVSQGKFVMWPRS